MYKRLPDKFYKLSQVEYGVLKMFQERGHEWTEFNHPTAYKKLVKMKLIKDILHPLCPYCKEVMLLPTWKFCNKRACFKANLKDYLLRKKHNNK